jgi:SAM-dependent methyltransferase
MRPAWRIAVLVFALLVGDGLGALHAAQAPETQYQYEPVVGMPGKDVVWVPTPPHVVQRMLDVAKVTAADFVIDLGSGDGRIVIAAGKRGARGFGVDLNPELVQLSNEEAVREGVAELVQFHVRDIFKTDLSPASVLTTYLLPQVNIRVRPQLLAQMKPGSRVVTYAFHMGEWQPDAVVRSRGLTVHYWIVPAAAMGKWRWDHDGIGFSRAYEMDVRQKFQIITGEAHTPNSIAYLRDMKLEGDHISFRLTEEAGSALAQTYYQGRIDGDAIVGTARTNDQAARAWTAHRTGGRTPIEAPN